MTRKERSSQISALIHDDPSFRVIRGCFLQVFFLILIGAHMARGQDAHTNLAPLRIEIIKYKWSKEIALPSNWDWTPFSASSGSAAEASASVSDSELPPGSVLPPVERLPFFFVYSLKVRNTSDQEITGIYWNYFFIDPGSNEALAAHPFLSYESVPVNTSLTLRVKSRVPPSKTVSVQGLEKDKRSPYFERVEIKCVMYADGTMWKPPAAKMSDCAYLKLGDKLRKMDQERRGK